MTDSKTGNEPAFAQQDSIIQAGGTWPVRIKVGPAKRFSNGTTVHFQYADAMIAAGESEDG